MYAHYFESNMSDNQQGAIGTAYGAGKAGAPFDPLVYIKKPQVILRLVSLVSDANYHVRAQTVFTEMFIAFSLLIDSRDGKAQHRSL